MSRAVDRLAANVTADTSTVPKSQLLRYNAKFLRFGNT